MHSRKPSFPSWRIALTRAAPAVITWFGLWEGLLLLLFHRELVPMVWLFHYMLLIPFVLGFLWMRRVIGCLFSRNRTALMGSFIFIPLILLFIFIRQTFDGSLFFGALADLGFYLLPIAWGVITWLFIQALVPPEVLKLPFIFDHLVVGLVAGLLWMAQWDPGWFLRWSAFAGLVLLAMRRWHGARKLYRSEDPGLNGAAKGGWLLLRPLWRSHAIVMFWLAGMAGLSLIHFQPVILTIIWFFHFIMAILMLMLVDYGHQSRASLSFPSMARAKPE